MPLSKTMAESQFPPSLMLRTLKNLTGMNQVLQGLGLRAMDLKYYFPHETNRRDPFYKTGSFVVNFVM